MKRSTAITLVTISALTLATPRDGATQSFDACVPDWSQLAVMNDRDTMDDVYAAVWCGTPNPSEISASYASALRLGINAEYWEEQWRIEGGNVCRPLTTGNRLFNATAFMEELWLNRGNSTLAAQNGSLHWLVDYIHRDSKGYVNTCRLWSENVPGSGVIASNPRNDDPTELHARFYWEQTVAERAATLVHENAHESSYHLDDNPCGVGSCDRRFQVPNLWPFEVEHNAQTWNIWFLGEAVDTYRRDPSDPYGRLQIVNLGTVLSDPGQDEICGYWPMLSPAARFWAVQTMQAKLTRSFVFPTAPAQFPAYARVQPTAVPLYDYGGNEYAVDRAWDARWTCGHICDPADYDFAAGGRYACNEDHQSGNAERNLRRRLLCESIETQIAGGVSREEWETLRLGFGSPDNPGAIPCIPGYSNAFLDAYCDRRIAAAGDVHDIGGGWNLPDPAGYVDTDFQVRQCEWEYCAGQFDPQWLVDARTNCFEWSDTSPPDCLNALCGDLAAIASREGPVSRAYFDAVHCRKTLLEGFAQVTLPDPPSGVCDEAYRGCRVDQAYEQWRAARLQGYCSLVPAAPATTLALDITPLPLPVPPPVIALPDLVLDSIRVLDYAAFQARFPGVAVDRCEARLSLCEASAEKAAEVAAKFVAVSEVPERLLLPNVLPEGLPIDILLPEVDANVRKLAEVVVDGPDESGLTPEEALRRLMSIPEAQHALTHALGKEAYFALFGVEGRLPVFGAEVVEAFAEPVLRFDFELNQAQQALLPSLVAVSQVRARIASPETTVLIEQAATLAEQPVFYDFVRSTANAADTGELNMLLDQLPQLAQ